MVRTQALLAAISGVLYAEDFDEPLLSPPAADPGARCEPELIIPHFSLDELRAAAEQAREEGRDDERRAAATSIATRRAAALAKLAEQVAITQQKSLLLVEQSLDELARTLLSLFAAALPSLCATHAQAELRSVLQQVLPPLRQLPELHIRLHPSVRDGIQNETEALLEGSSVRVTWIDSNKILPGDIAVSWNGGALLRDTTAICNEISNAVLALFDNERTTVAPENDDGQ